MAVRPEVEVYAGMPRTFLFRLTPASCEALAGALSMTYVPARELLGDSATPRVCMRIPAAHAELLARGVWPSYSIPRLHGASARLGTHFVPDLGLPPGLPRQPPQEASFDAAALDQATASVTLAAGALGVAAATASAGDARYATRHVPLA